MAEHNQQFDSFQEWVNKGQSWLTRHPQWGGYFKAICFDTKGRHVNCGGDFRRAEEEGAFPVRWLWPDQVGQMAALNAEMLDALKGLLDRYHVMGCGNGPEALEAARVIANAEGRS